MMIISFFELFKNPLWNYLVYQEIISFRKPKNFVCIKSKIKKKKEILIDKNIVKNIDLFKTGVNKFFYIY